MSKHLVVNFSCKPTRERQRGAGGLGVTADVEVAASVLDGQQSGPALGGA